MEANIDFVTDRIAIGGDLDTHRPSNAEAQLAGLVAQGITHLVDCRSEWSDADFVADRAPQIEYLHNGTHDDGGRQSADFFDRGLAFSRSALELPGTKVLLHCHMGVNRGPSMGFSVLLDQGYDPIDAMDAIRAARPIAAASYAEDALRHHLIRAGADQETTRRELLRLTDWWARNPIDVVRIIRQIRLEGKAA